MALGSSWTVLLLLLLTLNLGHCQEQQQQSGPTAEDCQEHIDAALKEFAAGQQETSSKHQAYTTVPDESDEVQLVSAEADSGTSEEAEIGTEDSPQQESEEASEELTDGGDHEEEEETQTAETESEEQRDERSIGDDESGEEGGSKEQDGGEALDKSEEDEGAEAEAEESSESSESGEAQEEEEFQSKTNDEDEGSREKRDVDSSEVEDRDEGESDEQSDRRNANSNESVADEGAADDSRDEGIATGNITATDASHDGDSHSSAEQSEEEVAEEEKEEEEADASIEEEEEVIVAGPGELKSREPIETILGLTEATDAKAKESVSNAILKDVKRMYESAVRPLEQLYKFKDISNRQMGDAEIFSKPMIVFMGPWSTGKSAIINYLLGTEYSRNALKTGAEPTSNSFTVVMYGETEQALDGTQIAADWAFSTLQKFGQTFLDKLRGRRMPNPLLQKVTIVDTPGIFENRKSTERKYPFNDAFQWFIDRADLIYIVFDPTKLDVGPELEALFDQIKGRENQVRILLNKADTVKPQELMKVQGTLLWNLSPEMGTSEAPTVFVGSFWSRPYLPGSPVTLLDAQEEALLEDLGDALKNHVEAKVALARRHAVRVRNHAKMVDCYLTTYYNHKSIFSNKRKVADDIIENPQNYHIYEGLSTMTNVSRYDLPDPEIYREFFHVHPLFDFKPLASTCSYFKGCPLDKLDIVIAYDLPELVTKYHKLVGVH